MTDQKVAIVTGASSGIGRATAVALAKQGVKVTVAARRAKEGEETEHLVKKAGSEGIFVKTDVANEDNVKSLVEKTVKMYDRLDYAFNNEFSYPNIAGFTFTMNFFIIPLAIIFLTLVLIALALKPTVEAILL